MKTVTTPLPARVVNMVDFWLADPKRDQTRAAELAGFNKRSAAVRASIWLKDPRVKALIVEKTKALVEKFELTQADVLRDVFNVVKADARDLSEYRIGCCRYCHGIEFRYQMTPQEYRNRLAAYMERHATKDPCGLAFPMEGGVGYDKRKKPHKDCPECFGEGEGREVFKDSRSLSESARTLYSGVKRTKNGIEIMTRSKDKAVEMAARHTGVIKQFGDGDNDSELKITVIGGLPDES